MSSCLNYNPSNISVVDLSLLLLSVLLACGVMSWWLISLATYLKMRMNLDVHPDMNSVLFYSLYFVFESSELNHSLFHCLAFLKISVNLRLLSFFHLMKSSDVFFCQFLYLNFVFVPFLVDKLNETFLNCLIYHGLSDYFFNVLFPFFFILSRFNSVFN